MRSSRARAALATCVILLAVVAAACSSDDKGSSATSGAANTGAAGTTAAPDSTPDTSPSTTVDMSGVTLKVGISGETPLSVTRSLSGAFDGTPYKVEWVDFDGSNAIMESLAAGAIDASFTLQAPVAVIAQANAGEAWTSASAPISVVAAWLSPATPGFVLVAHKDSGITDVKSLAGHKVAFARGTLGQYYFLAATKAAGLADGAVEQAAMPAADGRTAFRSGAVDALITGYRTGIALERTGDGVIIGNSQDITPYYTVSAVRAGLLDDPARAAAVNDMLQRLAVNEEWMHAHPDLAAQGYVSVQDMNPTDALKAATTEWRAREPLDDVTAQSIQGLADLFTTAGVAKSTVDVTVLFDRRFDDGIVRSS